LLPSKEINEMGNLWQAYLETGKRITLFDIWVIRFSICALIWVLWRVVKNIKDILNKDCDENRKREV